jgi:hypothetical protein
MPTCKSCGAEIVWAKTIKGRPIPLDPAPSPRGNIVIGEAGIALVYNAPAGIAPRFEDAPRYLSHFATCPDADLHRVT